MKQLLLVSLLTLNSLPALSSEKPLSEVLPVGSDIKIGYCRITVWDGYQMHISHENQQGSVALQGLDTGQMIESSTMRRLSSNRPYHQSQRSPPASVVWEKLQMSAHRLVAHASIDFEPSFKIKNLSVTEVQKSYGVTRSRRYFDCSMP